jgi:hypothetical protein
LKNRRLSQENERNNIKKKSAKKKFAARMKKENKNGERLFGDVATAQAVRQHGEARGKFDFFVNDVARQVEPNRRVIPNSANADFDEFVGDRLRGAGRNGNDSHFDRPTFFAAKAFGGRRDLVERANDATVNFLPEERRIRVERGDDVETVRDETLVIENSASKVPDAD